MALTATQYGSLSISDLLRTSNTSIIDFGVQDVFEVLGAFFRDINKYVQEQVSMFADRTTERVVGVGGPAAMTATYTDEFGVADTQKVAGPSIQGYPLRKHQVPLQWTYQWMMNHTPAEMAAQAQDAAIADQIKVQSALRKAIFVPINVSFTDRLRDNMTIPVKALANSDGFPIPASPTGAIFNASSHSHYLGTSNAQPTPSDIAALLLNVTEHRAAGDLYLFVNQTFGNYIIANRAATYTEFAIETYVNQTYATTLTLGRGDLDPINQANRKIGVYQGAEVWVKPWVPAGVIWAFIAGVKKPLAMRIPDTLGKDNGDFRPVYQHQGFPFQCEIMEREYGFGVQDRVSAAVLSYGGSDTTYVQPSGL